MAASLRAWHAVSLRPEWSGGFLGRCDLLSPTTFYPCGYKRPSPDALCVCRREPEGLSEATPSLRRLFARPGKCTGRLHQHSDRGVLSTAIPLRPLSAPPPRVTPRSRGNARAP